MADNTEPVSDTVRFIFEEYDTNRDGHMSRKEFFTFLWEVKSAPAEKLTEGQMISCWNALDTNQDGTISLREFAAGLDMIYENNFFAAENGIAVPEPEPETQAQAPAQAPRASPSMVLTPETLPTATSMLKPKKKSEDANNMYNTVKFKKSAAVAVFDKLVEDEKKLQREKSAKKAQKAAEEEARKAKAKQASIDAFGERMRFRRNAALAAKAAEEAAAAALAEKLPYYSGYLHSKEGKMWVRRLVVLRDEAPVPTLGIYDEEAADPPDRITLIQEVKLEGDINVDDYAGTQDMTGRFSLKRVKPRPNAFTILVGNDAYTLEAISTAAKAGWLEMLRTYITRVVKRRTSAKGGAATGSAITHRGFVNVNDNKGTWAPRFLVLRYGVMPTIAIYDGSSGREPDVDPSSAAAAKPVAELRLNNKVDMYEDMPQNDLVSLTLRKSEPKPNAFYLVVDDVLWALEAESPTDRLEWMDKILDYVMRYKLTGGLAPTPVQFDGLPTFHGFLVVQDKGDWSARLCYLRDGPTPTLSIYDATAKEPVERSMLLAEIPLVGYVEVADSEVQEGGSKLAFKPKATPRPNSFAVFVNDRVYNFEAASADTKLTWVRNLESFIEKYRLDENEPMTPSGGGSPLSSSRLSLSALVARKQPSSAKIAALETSNTTAGEIDLQNLPEGVANPFEEDYEGDFRNKIYSTAAATKAKNSSSGSGGGSGSAGGGSGKGSRSGSVSAEGGEAVVAPSSTTVSRTGGSGKKQRSSALSLFTSPSKSATPAPAESSSPAAATPATPVTAADAAAQAAAAPVHIERLPTLNSIELLPSYGGYLDVQDKSGGWAARFCHVRDGPVPTLAFYDAIAKDTVDRTLFINDVALIGYVVVRDVKPPDAGRLTFRARSAPRLNGFTLIVNESTFSFEAPGAEAKLAWVRKLASIIDKYSLNENEPIKAAVAAGEAAAASSSSAGGQRSSGMGARSGSRDVGPEDTAAGSAAVAMAVSAAAAAPAQELDLHALPEGVINPLEDDHAIYDDAPVFANALFGRD